MKLLERWPVDSARPDRDLGQLVRRRVAGTFPKGPASVVADEAGCDKDLASLTRLSTDVHRARWERRRATCATGHQLEDLNETLSDEGLVAMAKEGGLEGFKRRMKDNLNSLSPSSSSSKSETPPPPTKAASS